MLMWWQFLFNDYMLGFPEGYCHIQWCDTILLHVWGAIYWYLILLKTCKLLSEGRIFNFLMVFLCFPSLCYASALHKWINLFSQCSLWSELHGIPFFLVHLRLSEWYQCQMYPRVWSPNMWLSKVWCFWTISCGCDLPCPVPVGDSCFYTSGRHHEGRVFPKKDRDNLEVEINSGAETSFKSGLWVGLWFEVGLFCCYWGFFLRIIRYLHWETMFSLSGDH